MTFAYEILKFLKQHGNEEIREYVRLVIEQQAIKRGLFDRYKNKI